MPPFCADICSTCIKSVSFFKNKQYFYLRCRFTCTNTGIAPPLCPSKAWVIKACPSLLTTVFVFVTRCRRETWRIDWHVISSTFLNNSTSFSRTSGLQFPLSSSIHYLLKAVSQSHLFPVLCWTTGLFILSWHVISCCLFVTWGHDPVWRRERCGFVVLSFVVYKLSNMCVDKLCHDVLSGDIIFENDRY